MFILLLLAAQGDPATLVDTARRMTSAEQRCVQDPHSTDITVCGLRHADRFRVPLDTHATARGDDLTGQRAALLHERTPMEGMGPFLVGGGMAGVKGGIGFGPGKGSGAVSGGGLRPLAP